MKFANLSLMQAIAADDDPEDDDWVDPEDRPQEFDTREEKESYERDLDEREASKTAADDFGYGGGVWASLMQWLRGGGDKGSIPSWFPKRLLTEQEISTGRWIENGAAYASLDKAADRRVHGAWGIFRTSDHTPVYGPTTQDAVEMAMESGRYPAGQFFAMTMPDVGHAPWEGNPFADVEVRNASPYFAAVQARQAKITEITLGLMGTNPGLDPKAARKLAVETVERFPQVVKGTDAS